MHPHRATHLVLLLAALIPAGCGAEAIVLSAGLSAAQQGAVDWVNGRLVGVFNRTFECAIAATDSMASDLSLQTRSRKLNEGTFVLSLQDDSGRDIVAKLRRRSATLTEISIRVGFWGNKPTSSLVLGTIEHHMSKADVKPMSPTSILERLPHHPNTLPEG